MGLNAFQPGQFQVHILMVIDVVNADVLVAVFQEFQSQNGSDKASSTGNGIFMKESEFAVERKSDESGGR